MLSVAAEAESKSNQRDKISHPAKPTRSASAMPQQFHRWQSFK
jgi:hypothetical protein